MASAMHALSHEDFTHGVEGVGGALLGGGLAFATGFGIGELYHRKGDKWYGKHAPKIVTAVGKAAAIASCVLGGPQLLTGSMNAIGDAAAATLGLEYGLKHARSSSGVKGILWPKDKALPPGAKETALGAAPAGKGMTWDQVEELARSR